MVGEAGGTGSEVVMDVGSWAGETASVVAGKVGSVEEVPGGWKEVSWGWRSWPVRKNPCLFIILRIRMGIDEFMCSWLILIVG